MAVDNNGAGLSPKEIFFEAIEQETPHERAAYLDRACGDDSALRERVVQLLAQHFDPGSFMEEPAFEADSRVPPAVALAEGPGSRIGRYKLLQTIGEGGMGVVYMAEQEEPVRRRVALKIIKLGMDTRQVVARFEAERQALALMDHPNIARVLDGGATDAGRPYFVMELVQGIPITEFCDKNRLPSVERLKLFISVCQAVQSAHQKGIIHRDLKPSNILVTLNSGVPVVKVIDFGVAKATNQKLTEKTLFTNYGTMVGTPAYMSPEQAEMTSLDVDTRTDIYSLGVVLYELLTGTTPFPEKQLRSVGCREMQRIIIEDEPERPSTRLSTMQAEQRSMIAKNHGTHESGLAKSFASDLDWIVMKCLEKDRARRYETVSGLARDTQRYLDNEPIVARPPSRLYEFQKTVRRHKVGFAATAVVIVALAGGVVVSSWEAVQARSEQQRARKAQELIEQDLYAADMKLASEAWREGQVTDATNLLEDARALLASRQPDQRGFEWRYLWQATAEGEVERTLKGLPAPTPWGGGSFLLLVGNTLYNQSDDKLRAWDMTDGKPVALPLPQVPSWTDWWWSETTPDGFALDQTNGTLTVYQLPAFQTRATLPLPGPVSEIEISSDRRLLAVGCQQQGSWRVLAWDVSRGSQLGASGPFEQEIAELHFSPGCTNLAVASDDGEICVLDSANLKPLSQCLKPLSRSHDVWRNGGKLAFSPDGRRLVFRTSEFDEELHIWDWMGSGVQTLAQSEVGAASDFCFSPDGSMLASSWCSEAIILWDAQTLTKLGTLRGHKSLITKLAFSPDGRLLASASRDRTVRLWDLASQREVARPMGGFAVASDVIFSSDGSRVLALGGDGTVKVWNVKELLDRGVFARQPHMFHALAISPDDRTIASIDADGTLVLWDRASRHQTTTIPFGQPGTYRMAFSPSGGRLAWVSAKTVGIRSMTSGETNLLKIQGNLNLCAGIAFSPDSREVAFSGHTNVMLLDLETRQMRRFATLPDVPAATQLNEPTALAYSPDGSRLVVGDLYGYLAIYDRASGTNLFRFMAHDPLVRQVIFSPDGASLATCGFDSKVKLWSFLTNRFVLAAELTGHVGYIMSIAFSPDGTRLASIGGDHTLKLWDVTRRIEVGTLDGHHACAADAIFSKNGNTIYSAGQDGEIRMWEAPPLTSLAQPARGAVSSAARRAQLSAHNNPGTSPSP